MARQRGMLSPRLPVPSASARRQRLGEEAIQVAGWASRRPAPALPLRRRAGVISRASRWHPALMPTDLLSCLVIIASYTPPDCRLEDCLRFPPQAVTVANLRIARAHRYWVE